MLEILVKQNGVNKSLDLFGDDAISINYSIANIKDISNTNGAYTKTITIPDTPNNREIFGFITDLATDIEFNYTNKLKYNYNPNLKVKCWVIEDTIVVLEGYIQLTRYNIDDFNQNKVMECTIYGDNANFYITMGDKLLTDLDFSEYDFKYTIAGITASWTNDLNAYRKGYYFPLIDYGHGWSLNDLQDLSVYSLNVKDFLPAIYVKTIWDKIFSANNYSYTSKFLGSPTGLTNSTPDPRFANLVIPYYQQTFQTSTLFNQNKIFHVGLTFSQIGGGYNIKWYQSKNNTGTTYPKAIVNANVSTYPNAEFRRLWFNGIRISPADTDSTRNTAGNETYTTFRYGAISIPFTATASPMFNTFVNGGNTYNTSNFWYQNRSNEIFKQRFILKTDIVTTYSNQNLIEKGQPQTITSGTATGTGYNYIIKVEFFREYDPVTGTTSTAWAGGTGFQIPADLGPNPAGGAYNLATNVAGAIDKKTHWVCDIKGKSNCFTSDGKQIKPTGPERYLGKFCTNEYGTFLLNADTPGGDINFRRKSGDCITWYYNDGFNQTSTALTGLWVSGYDTFNYTTTSQATNHPGYGDWYQGLQLQTIFLDGDETNLFYGASGSIAPKANTPIQPNERVRVIITVGGKYKGQYITSTSTSYKPPTTAYVLTDTDFLAGGIGGLYNYNNLTQFYNDVQPEYITGQKISFNDIIPKNLKQRDFVQDIIRMHNLYIEPTKDASNNLLIEPREEYYKLGVSTLDWRNKLDINSPINIQVLAETQYKRTRFTYKADSDYYNKAYTNNTNEIYGQFVYVLDNEFLVDELKIESMFSPTPLTQLYSYYGENGGDTLINRGGFVLPVLVNGNNVKASSNAGPNGNVTSNFRILYKRYITNQNGEQIFIFNKKTNVYPYAGPYDNPYQPSYSLNWGQTLAEFFPTPTDQFYDNLVNTYWSALLDELGDSDSRIITCNMFLTPDDINKFYFYKLVFLTIDGVDGYYKVNSIENYQPGQNSLCKVTLLKSKTKLPKKFAGSTTVSPPGSVIILPGGGGGVILPGPSS